MGHRPWAISRLHRKTGNSDNPRCQRACMRGRTRAHDRAYVRMLAARISGFDFVLLPLSGGWAIGVLRAIGLLPCRFDSHLPPSFGCRVSLPHCHPHSPPHGCRPSTRDYVTRYRRMPLSPTAPRGSGRSLSERANVVMAVRHPSVPMLFRGASLTLVPSLLCSRSSFCLLVFGYSESRW